MKSQVADWKKWFTNRMSHIDKKIQDSTVKKKKKRKKEKWKIALEKGAKDETTGLVHCEDPEGSGGEGGGRGDRDGEYM